MQACIPDMEMKFYPGSDVVVWRHAASHSRVRAQCVRHVDYIIKQGKAKGAPHLLPACLPEKGRVRTDRRLVVLL